MQEEECECVGVGKVGEEVDRKGRRTEATKEKRIEVFEGRSAILRFLAGELGLSNLVPRDLYRGAQREVAQEQVCSGGAVYSGTRTTSYAASSLGGQSVKINRGLQRPLVRSEASQPKARGLATQGECPCAMVYCAESAV